MSSPVVSLQSATVRDDHGGVFDLSLDLPAGAIGALVGTRRDGTTALTRALCGDLRPNRGTLSVNGHFPWKSPFVRRTIGSLLDVPILPLSSHVRHLIAIARSLRAERWPREVWWTELGLERLAHVPTQELAIDQRRSVALALALSIPHPALIVLHDPLANVRGVNAHWLTQALRSRAETGTCVLILTPSAQDAVALADDVAFLFSGRIDHAVGDPERNPLAPSAITELQIWCDDPRSLASELVLESCVSSVQWNAGPPPGPLVVHALNGDATASSVARIALSRGIPIQSMRRVHPPTTQLRSDLSRLQR